MSVHGKIIRICAPVLVIAFAGGFAGVATAGSLPPTQVKITGWRLLAGAGRAGSRHNLATGGTYRHCAPNNVETLDAYFKIGGPRQIAVQEIWSLNDHIAFRFTDHRLAAAGPYFGISDASGLSDGLWSLKVEASGAVIGSSSVRLTSEHCGSSTRVTISGFQVRVDTGRTASRHSVAPGGTYERCAANQFRWLEAYFNTSGPSQIRVQEVWSLNGHVRNRFTDPDLAAVGPYFGIQNASGIPDGLWTVTVEASGTVIGSSSIRLSSKSCGTATPVGGGSGGGGGSGPTAPTPPPPPANYWLVGQAESAFSNWFFNTYGMTPSNFSGQEECVGEGVDDNGAYDRFECQGYGIDALTTPPVRVLLVPYSSTQATISQIASS